MLWTFVLELIVLGALFEQALGVPQDQGPTGSAPSCGGCILVADVAAIVWYSEVFVQTDTKLVAISVGNVTRVSSTSFIQNRGQVTFNPAATTSGGAAIGVTSVNYSPTITVAGANLTSPTPYNVFSAYTFTTATISDGVCVTATTYKSLTAAYSQTLSSALGQITLDRNGEQSFITEFLGLTECVGGGESVTPTAQLRVTATTETSTITGAFPTPAAAHTTSSAPSTNSFSSSSPSPSSSVFLGSPNSFTPPILSTVTQTSVVATTSVGLSGVSSPNTASAITSSHATISLAPLSMIVLNNQTLTPLSSSKTVAVGNITATANSAGAFVFPGSQTLSPGGSLTLSVGPGANATVVAFTGDAADKRVPLLLWISISACLVLII